LIESIFQWRSTNAVVSFSASRFTMLPETTLNVTALATRQVAALMVSVPALRRRIAGFTLVEAMVATTIFAMLTLGVYSALIKSYQIIALARSRDQARAVLRTYADQFMRLQTTEKVGASTFNRWLFNPTGGATGRGLRWGELSDRNTSTAAPIVSSIAIVLGHGPQTTPATLTRDVSYVNASTGEPSVTQQIDAAGFLLTATFAITYSHVGKQHVESLTVVRAAP
jgi:Tfp pilus assembly protein PilE